MNAKEIEIKLQIDEEKYYRLTEILKEIGKLSEEKHQIDIYYSPENESFYNAGDRCLRIRTEGIKSIISYKQIYDENTSKQFIEEFETSIENSNMMDRILRALKFRSEIIIDKYRIEYLIDARFKVALDKVKNLGCFIEIENINEFETLENRNQALIEFAKELSLDISQRNIEGYSNMMFRKNFKNED